ncbi:hypothetical protein MKW94_027174, partial [Papaver nudicaule]|nr:hypothetical protein [Papaver nudicaule]
MGSSKYEREEEGEARVSKVRRDDDKRSRDYDRRRSHRKNDTSDEEGEVRVSKSRDEDRRRSHRTHRDSDDDEDRHRRSS